jgi:hypothetical protein
MIDGMIFGAIGGMKFGRGNRSTRRKPTPAPICPPQNPTWQTRSRTPDRSGGKPATNRLSYGAAFLTVILVKNAVFCDITQFSPLKVNRRFKGIYRFHLQGWISRASWFATCFHADIFLGLIGIEDGGDMFLRKVVDFKRSARRYITKNRTPNITKLNTYEFIDKDRNV